MFELKRNQKIYEQLKIGDEIIDVSLDAGEIQSRFIKSYNEVIKAEKILQQDMTNNLESTSTCLSEYGNAVISVLQIVFGIDNTNKIINFYENNYIEMFSSVYPFIAEIIMPKIKESILHRTNELKALYKGKK